MEFNENALKIAPWSATKLKLAVKCPFRAYQAFVAKEKEVFTQAQNNSPMIVGIKMHTFMELMLSKFPKGQFPNDADLNLLGQRFRQVILKDEDITIEEKDNIHSIYDSALSVCQRLLSYKLKTQSVTMVEAEVGIDKHMKPIGFFDKDVFFRGKVDYLMITKNGAVAVIDHKTGQWPNLKGHELQLRAYEVMIVLALKNKIKEDYNIELSSFISGLAFIATEDVLWDKVKPLKLVEGSGIKHFVENLNRVADDVFKQTIKRGNHCDYCGYKHLCGSKRGLKKKKEAAVKVEL